MYGSDQEGGNFFHQKVLSALCREIGNLIYSVDFKFKYTVLLKVIGLLGIEFDV